MGGGGNASGLWGDDWISEESLLNHYNRHGRNTNTKTKEEYLAKAKNFVKSNSYGTLTKTDSRGSTYMYNPNTNEFVIVSKGGQIVTYFNPSSGIRYWEESILPRIEE